MLVSVYIPTRNRVTLLKDAVESVLGQTHREIELIVVNDASTDETEEYLREISALDSRLIYLNNQTSKGAPASRNSAILRATGEFVTGLDDDDTFMSERIGSFLAYWNLLYSIGDRPSCLYAQDVWLVNGRHSTTTRKRSSVTREEIFNYNYVGNQIFAPREHFLKAGLFDETLPAWQDLDLIIRILELGPGRLLDIPTYRFDATLRPDRISSQAGKIRAALELMIEKHAKKDRDRQLSLFLQMFQEGYNIRPTTKDWIKFLSFLRFPRGVRRMVRPMMTNHSMLYYHES